MKGIVRLFCLIIIGLSVFFGALLISRGMHAHHAAGDTPESSKISAAREMIVYFAEGSAL